MAKKRKAKVKKTGKRAYEAAQSTPLYRHVVGGAASPDQSLEGALERIREWGRYFDENLDIASGILDAIANQACGSSGITTIPKPRVSADSDDVDDELAGRIGRLWERWQRQCDVTGTISWQRAQPMAARACYRDGEVFVHHVFGRTVAYPWRNGDVPFRVEFLESDYCPRELTNDDGWRQGVRLNTWKMPREFAFWLEHPGDSLYGSPAMVTLDQVKTIPADLISHLKHVKRWPQTRGVSVFAPIVRRLYDTKDLEESERIKARNLSQWVAAIIKNPDVPGLDDSNEYGRRFHESFKGMLIDTLAPGEDIRGVGPDYPQPNMPEHIADQHRRLAAGTGTRYSTIARRYDGTYASQRQELVESEAYSKQRERNFVDSLVRPVYERFVEVAVLDGQLSLGPGQTIEDAQRAEYRGDAVPWIDPLKEVQADALAVNEGFASREQIQIKRGAPADLIGQEPSEPRQPAQLELLQEPDSEAA